MIDKLLWYIAYKIPHKLAKYIFIRVATYASVSKFRDKEMGSITVFNILEAWEMK